MHRAGAGACIVLRRGKNTNTVVYTTSHRLPYVVHKVSNVARYVREGMNPKGLPEGITLFE